MTISVKVMSYIEQSSWIRKMFEEGAALRKIHGEENVFDFTLGNPSLEPPAAFRQELLKLAQNPLPGMHRYMNNAGYEKTRTAIAEVLSEHSSLPVKARHLVMTCGAGGGLNVVLKTILNPDEEVILLAPYFVEYKFYVDNHGGIAREIWTDRETFQLDIDTIEKTVGPNTRAIIINSPNNPTGVIYPEASLMALGQMLERKEKELKRQIYVISDEPYARLTYNGQKVPGIFSCIKNSVIVSSHSKDLALPGERIGYLAANPSMTHVDQLGCFLQQSARFCQCTGPHATPGCKIAKAKRRHRGLPLKTRSVIRQSNGYGLQNGEAGRRLLSLPPISYFERRGLCPHGAKA